MREKIEISHADQIAIVIPFFNEQDRFNERYFEMLASWSFYGIHFLLVDDGSTDNTSDLLKKFSAKHKRFACLTLAENVGKGEAIRRGIISLVDSKVPYVGFGYLDADGAFQLQDILNCFNVWQMRCLGGKYDAIFMSRLSISGRNISRKKSRHIIGRLISSIVRIGLPSPPWDTQAGLKIFKREKSFMEAIQIPFCTRWLFDIEILQRVFLGNTKGLLVWEEPLEYWRDTQGSKLGFTSFFDIFRSIIYVLTINVTQVLPKRIKEACSEKDV